MPCQGPIREIFFEGEWFHAAWCFFTSGGDPAMQVFASTAIFGTMLLGLYITSQSLLLPAVVSIILAGVIFAMFPASGVSLVLILLLLLFGVGGTLITWQLSRTQ